VLTFNCWCLSMLAAEMTVSPRKAPCLIYPTLPQEPQIKYTDCCIFSCRFNWSLCDYCWHSCWCLTTVQSVNHRVYFCYLVCLSSYWLIFMNTAVLYMGRICSLCGMKERVCISNVMFRFCWWRWRWWFRSKKEDWIQSHQQQSCSYQHCSAR